MCFLSTSYADNYIIATLCKHLRLGSEYACNLLIASANLIRVHF